MWESIVLSTLDYFLGKATPKIRTDLDEALNVLKRKAKETPNPIDDILVDQLIKILGSKSND